MQHAVVSIPPAAGEPSAADGTGAANQSSAPFVAGPENYLAAWAALSLCLDTAEPCWLEASASLPAAASIAALDPRNFPLVLHGASGAGKSHLAAQMAAAWRAAWPARAVVVAACVDFARQFQVASDAGSCREFHEKYRAADLLVLEDLHQVLDKPAAQEELARTIDALLDRQAGVILTAPALPGDLAGLIPALRSRLEGGLVIGLKLPAAAARRQLVAQLASMRGWKLAPAALDRLATAVVGSARELRAALVALELERGDDGELDAPAVERCLARAVGRPAPTLRAIAEKTARHAALRLAEMRGPSRRRAVVRARGMAIYLARKLTPASLGQIGDFFGGRDHATVLHAYRTMAALLEADATLRRTLGELELALESR